jgi:hypothetical protein
MSVHCTDGVSGLELMVQQSSESCNAYLTGRIRIRQETKAPANPQTRRIKPEQQKLFKNIMTPDQTNSWLDG